MGATPGYDLGAPWPGMLTHHSEDCPARLGQPCICGPLGYRASVEDGQGQPPVVGPVLPTVEQAQAWQQEQTTAMHAFQAASGRPPDEPVSPGSTGDTVGELVDDFLEAARAGQARDARGQAYGDDRLPDLRWSLRSYVASDLGAMRITDLRSTELRAFIGRLDSQGLSRGRTRAVVRALRALLRYAAERGMVSWSAADLLVFGDTDQLPNAPTPAPEPEPLPLPPPSEFADEPARAPVMPTAPAMVTAPAMAAAPATAPARSPLQGAAGSVPDEVIWLILKIVTLVFALISLVLVAESV